MGNIIYRKSEKIRYGWEFISLKRSKDGKGWGIYYIGNANKAVLFLRIMSLIYFRGCV